MECTKQRRSMIAARVTEEEKRLVQVLAQIKTRGDVSVLIRQMVTDTAQELVERPTDLTQMEKPERVQ